MVRNFAWWVILLMNWGSCVESGCNVDCVQRMFKNSLNTSLIVGKILNYPYLLNSGDNLLIFIILLLLIKNNNIKFPPYKLFSFLSITYKGI